MIKFETMILGLAISCPLDRNNIECPIEEIRKLNLREKINFISKLEKVERDSLLSEHKLCIKNYENEFFKNLRNPEEMLVK